VSVYLYFVWALKVSSNQSDDHLRKGIEGKHVGVAPRSCQPKTPPIPNPTANFRRAVLSFSAGIQSGADLYAGEVQAMPLFLVSSRSAFNYAPGCARGWLNAFGGVRYYIGASHLLPTDALIHRSE